MGATFVTVSTDTGHCGHSGQCHVSEHCLPVSFPGTSEGLET